MVRLVVLAGVAAVLLLLGNNVRWAQPQPQPQQRAGQLAPAALTDAWVLTTFTDGRVLGEGMHVLGLTLGGGPAAFLCAGLPTLAFHCDRRQRRDGLPARFGYARSRDLLSWSDSRPVTVPLPGACNVWAPEIYLLTRAEAASRGPLSADGRLAVAMVVVSISTPASGSEELSDCPWDFGPSAGASRHRPYQMLTSDFERWTPPALLFEPLYAESAIDALLFRAPHPPNKSEARGAPPRPDRLSGGPGAERTYVVYKSEKNGDPSSPCEWRRGQRGAPLGAARCTLVLRLLVGPSPFGPFAAAPLDRTPVWSDAISHQMPGSPRGGPARRGSAAWVVLYDGYRTDCPLKLAAPPGHQACERLVSSGLDGGRPAAASASEPAAQCTYRGRPGLGALVSDDLRSWRDGAHVASTIPRHHKHGTALQLSGEALCALCGGIGGVAPHAREARRLWEPVTGMIELCARTACGTSSS
ncbi:hypothetical protein EMIHUDRAFT_244628 [Emiliania huxleyi CCMP1516]|uniref:Uncharacterized protein n=2 Tax=Emiliania huxleyi TaxID=2903 RepID=A0A0D3J0D5_EMIH1|nr:hypothetical protein EMIHUDRAFT_244628 [Emiliania huxleyi CCMP1516]EOD16970.1 hypothetical protein EMIHUDRAFT_244628 [Emiliania huxleyi CCMP1516]|eukprot:XP_005769399.1 hypothetical protein EMIHUDRAFT_244628 [Emiliania huxleyi CCMP1516]